MRRAALATAAILLCSIDFASPAIAEPPPDFDLSHHPSPALSPGVGIGIYDADNQPVDTCTAGWLIHDGNGQPGLLTAGHCDDGGDVTFFNQAKGFQIVGAFTHKALGGEHGEDEDIAVLGIGNATPGPPVPTDARIIGVRPIVRPVEETRLVKGQQLCHFGLISGPRRGGPECGPIVELRPTTVRFDAHVTEGDSGGPVYVRNADGTATPVGITIRDGDDGGTVAQLIGPWLTRWHLRLDA
ncbi:hypothetical protein PT015_24375 [Candidatus Mycobacterium wuenschmannii]|uniref:Endopeptidase n=1 Tax=Candidatus Mycobacterium wuenschmannii TaxID=3027808 RepID=A0ABY8VX73_9MYCO|nr:hypothetical protein [Candidatus Mycobacterium wuenschmannii]WIM87916.1 hypothetical protein PT015_24375 [Candidatus Mycobacterium wuenschmannii]